jgi:hypothetical protein
VRKNVKEIPALNGRYTITPKENRFTIDRTTEHDAGKYACSVGNDEVVDVNVVGKFIKISRAEHRIDLKIEFQPASL